VAAESHNAVPAVDHRRPHRDSGVAAGIRRWSRSRFIHLDIQNHLGIRTNAPWLYPPMNALASHRDLKNRYFASAPDSPIPHTTAFTGLSYFDEDPELRFEAPLRPGDGSVIRVPTSDGQERTYTRDGLVDVVVAETPISLTLYGTGHGLFLPFRDSTSGNETYGAGRYLDIDAAANNTVTIDFNLAYNPYCAYNDAYSCPLPPGENWLTVAIRAGEKSYPA
jgi:uncharacterized protein